MGSLRGSANFVKLKTSNFIIVQSQKVKFLGMYISASLSNVHNVNNLVSKINYRLITLKKVTRYADLRTSKMIANGIIISVFKYSCPLMINSDIILHNKLNSLLIKCTRPLLGFISYKWNTLTIMKKLGWVTYHKMV